jgi:hypothetical protein
VEEKPAKLVYDAEIETAISHAGIFLAKNPEDVLNGNRLVLAQNLQLCRKAIQCAVKSAMVAKDGRVWISQNALEGLKKVMPAD